MEKRFVKINPLEYAKKGIESGELKPVVAVKFARVIARRGNVGDEVISYSQDGIIEKVATVTLDAETKEAGWILTKADENGEVIVDEYGHTNDWIVDAKTFARKYEVDETKVGVYKPKGGPQVFIPIVMDVTLEQWGSEMNIAAGGWLNITNLNDVYGISQRDFEDTYKIVSDEPNYKLTI